MIIIHLVAQKSCQVAGPCGAASHSKCLGVAPVKGLDLNNFIIKANKIIFISTKYSRQPMTARSTRRFDQLGCLGSN